MTQKADNNICKEHSGCVANIEHLIESDKGQWKEINKMKKWFMLGMATLVCILLTGIVNLAVLLAMK